MDGIIIKFGDVFRHKEKEYVFLAQTEDTIFAAKIIDDKTTSILQAKSDNKETSMSKQRKIPLYSFVMLSTKDFEGRAAHFASTDSSEHQSVSQFDVICTLEKKDIQEIKSEIECKDSVVPIRLIEVVKQLNIT